MLPSFSGPARQRQINLGGSSSTYTQEAILSNIKAQREQRQDFRKRQESALKLQAWWRGRYEARRVKGMLKERFDKSPGPGVEWTRWLVVGWQGGAVDSERLGRWSTTMTQSGNAALFGPFQTPQKDSWLVLLRQTSLLLLQEVSKNPTSQHAVYHLRVLNAIFSAKHTSSMQLAEYLLRHGLYVYIASALQRIPLEDKAAPSLPLLATLATQPFSIFPSTSKEYPETFSSLIQHILSLPLLPNRFPLDSLKHFSSRLPFAALNAISPLPFVESAKLSPAATVHLLANLAAFVPPRLATLPTPSLSAYLQLLAALLETLPSDTLDPPSKRPAASTWTLEDDSDQSDGEDVDMVPATPPKPIVTVDARTSNRLQTLVSPGYVNNLLSLASKTPALRLRLFKYLLAMGAAWPSRRDKLTSSVVYSKSGPLLMKDVWRGWVRGSCLGKDAGTDNLTASSQEDAWLALIFLVDIYTHALLTMGDDEFFSTATGTNSPRNPLTLDELAAFSKQLLHIVFALYWNEDQLNIKEERVPGMQVTWEAVRERLTKCLKAIHARDSRRKFTPEDHWLMTSHIDIQSFREAAIYEEQNLDRTSTRTLSKRQMAYISPRLGVLNNIPFAIPFAVRVEIFRDFVSNDMMLIDARDNFGYHCTVRRDHIAKDGYDMLNPLGPKLKKRVRITFIDQFGSEERGIDGGGVFKEFLTSLSKEAFDTDRGLWLATTQQALYPNPHSYAKEPHQLSWYRFIGRVLGKALYEGILVDVNFATFFLAKWLGKQSHLDDLASLDPELYQGLIFLKHYEGNVEDLALNFTVNHNDLGVTKTVNLLPNGANIPVTKENRTQYIYLVANYRLNTQIRAQSEAFFDGLSDIIDPKWLRMFNQQELRILIGGTEDPIDIDDLQANTVYGGAYNESHETIQSFWKVLKSFDQAQRCAVLRFVTSCARPPLLGFKELNPKFAIRDSGSDNSRLPTASTCVNLLKLPMYDDERTLRRKLLQAVYSGAGFDLS